MSIRANFARNAILLLALASLIGPAELVAQDTGHIQIRGEPDVQIFLQGELAGMTTEESGGLIVQDIPAGRYELLAVKPGYEPQEALLTVEANRVLVHSIHTFRPQIEITQEGVEMDAAILREVGTLIIQTLPVESRVRIGELGVDVQKTRDVLRLANITTGNLWIEFFGMGVDLAHGLELAPDETVSIMANFIERTVTITERRGAEAWWEARRQEELRRSREEQRSQEAERQRRALEAERAARDEQERAEAEQRKRDQELTRMRRAASRQSAARSPAASRMGFRLDFRVPEQPMVEDLTSKLMWWGCPSGMQGPACGVGEPVSVRAAAASVICGGMDWGGHDDWRLPSAGELEGILQRPSFGAVPDAPGSANLERGLSMLFPRLVGLTLWSGTQENGELLAVTLIERGDESERMESPRSQNRLPVLCVRDGEEDVGR